MEQYNDGAINTKSRSFLSWRNLHLSRAKLRASSETSTLLTGFAMMAMVEMNIGSNLQNDSILLVFAICTTLLVAVHMLALMISICILPNIEVICDLNMISLVKEAPHKRLHWYIETAWAISTLLGLLLFLAEIAIICRIKFYNLHPYAAWSAVFILVPVLVIFLVFAVHFYHSMMVHKYDLTSSDIRELELIKEKIEARNSLSYESSNKTIIEIV